MDNIQLVDIQHSHEYTLYPRISAATQGERKHQEQPGLLPLVTELSQYREHVLEKDGPNFTGPMKNNARNNNNVLPRTFGTIDLDGVTDEELTKIMELFAGAGLFCASYSDRRENEEGYRFYRCFYSFDRAVTPEEYKKASMALCYLIVTNVPTIEVDIEDTELLDYRLSTRQRIVHFKDGETKPKRPVDTASGVVSQGMYTPAFNSVFWWTDLSKTFLRTNRDGVAFEEQSLSIDWLLSLDVNGWLAPQLETHTHQQPAVIEPVIEPRSQSQVEQGRYMGSPASPHRPDIDQRIIGVIMMYGIFKRVTRTAKGETAYVIRCPWYSQHTTGGDEAYFLPSTPDRAWCFVCHHTTHGKKTAAEFADAIGLNPADVLTSEVIRRERREAYAEANTARVSDFEDLSALEYPEHVMNAEDAYLDAFGGYAQREAVKTFEPVSDGIMALFKERETRPPAIPTGLEHVDKLLNGGFRPGLYLLGAAPGMGKTALALQIADNIAATGRNVLFYSLEMVTEELVDRSLCRISKQQCYAVPEIDAEPLTLKAIEEELRNAGMRSDKLAKPFHEYVEGTADGQRKGIAHHLYVIDTDEPYIEDIETSVNAFYDQNPDGVVFVDYLQLLRIKADPRTSADPILRLADISRRLKVLSKRGPLIVISSVNRESYYNLPGLDAFKASGDIEFSANAALVLTPAKYTDSTTNNRQIKATVDNMPPGMPKPLELHLVKGRALPLGKCGLLFDGAHYAIHSIDKDHVSASLQYLTHEQTTTPKKDTPQTQTQAKPTRRTRG